MEFCTIRDIPQQTFINAANGKSTYPLPQILTVHLYHNGHTNGFRLVVILQSLIIPYDIRIDNILRTRFANTNSDTEREKNGVSATSTRTRL